MILNYQEGWTLFNFTSPPIYRKLREKLATQLAQASKVASSRSNRLLEESSGGTKWFWLLFAPPFLLNTPPAFFLCFFFRKVTETYEFHNDTCFLSVMLWNLVDYIIIPFLTYGTLRNLTNYATMLPFRFPICDGTLQIVHQYFLLIFGMSQNFTNCLMMGAKHLTRTKQKLHATKQRSPDEIRVWQLPLFTCLLLEIKGK